MSLSDGRVRTFELPIAKFHEIRYNAAKVRFPLPIFFWWVGGNIWVSSLFLLLNLPKQNRSYQVCESWKVIQL